MTCRAFRKTCESMLASARCFVISTDCLLPEGLIQGAGSNLLICSRDEKYPSSSIYQMLPFGYEAIKDWRV